MLPLTAEQISARLTKHIGRFSRQTRFPFSFKSCLITFWMTALLCFQVMAEICHNGYKDALVFMKENGEQDFTWNQNALMDILTYTIDFCSVYVLCLVEDNNLSDFRSLRTGLMYDRTYNESQTGQACLVQYTTHGMWPQWTHTVWINEWTELCAG